MQAGPAGRVPGGTGGGVVTGTVHVVASLWIEEGRLDAFEAYERKAAGIMKRYGGAIERVVRAEAGRGDPEQPFEVHLIRFPSRAMFDAYRADPDLLALAPERSAAIARTRVVVGEERPGYGA